jgi:hypothetical protein
MAAPDNFILTLRGRGGHAARLDKTADPVTVAANVILALQTMLTRRGDFFDRRGQFGRPGDILSASRQISDQRKKACLSACAP